MELFGTLRKGYSGWRAASRQIRDFRTPPPIRFEDEFPDEGTFLADIYEEAPRYHRQGRYHYLTKHWHVHRAGVVLEGPHPSK